MVPPEQPFDDTAYRLTVAGYESTLSDGTKKAIGFMGSSPEAYMLNNVIAYLKPDALDQAKQNLRFFSEDEKERPLREKAQRKVKLVEDIRKIVDQEGLSFADVAGEADAYKVFSSRKDDIQKIYIALRNRGFTEEELRG